MFHRTSIALLLILTLGARFSLAQSVTKIVPDGKPHKFEAKDHQFFIDGDPTLLIAGEMHFGRVQPQDWETRIRQAKAMGLNTISFYLFWNMVEPKEGQFNFTGMTDVKRVLQLCKENGMWCILRPGPYCCAEIEYGGIPYWTLKYPDVKIRTADPKWMEWSKNYLKAVHEQLADLTVDKGGPLLMVQVENEYGITGPTDNTYMTAMTKAFKEAGFDTQLFTCDPTTKIWTDPSLRVDGLMYCRNGLTDDSRARSSAEAIGNYPIFVPEVYTAWFSGWSEPIATRNGTIPEIIKSATYLLDHKDSWTFYMFFGGTNYGYYNGCNFFLPVQTSYDYNAPIDEAGRTTPKFKALRELISSKLHITPPDAPPEPKVIALPAIHFTETQPLLATLPSGPTKTSARPLSFENLDQDYGFVDYRKQFPNGIKGKLELKDARDYTIVLVNGKTVGKAYVGYGPDSSVVEINEPGPATLDLLVYNLGRISVITSDKTQYLGPRGLIGGATLEGTELTDWQNYSLPYESVTNIKQSSTDQINPLSVTPPATGPTFYHATFNVNEIGGTFLDMTNWSFGVVWVNGHNLGRFWDRGGLRSLFVPANWLKQGANDIVVLELHDAPKDAEITGGDKIVEHPATAFPIKLDQEHPAARGARGARGGATAPATRPGLPNGPTDQM